MSPSVVVHEKGHSTILFGGSRVEMLDTTEYTKLKPKTKQKRASRPKTKTGCKGCRLRRVKCDETHPSCLRCLKYQGVCDGYSLDFSSRSRIAFIPSGNASKKAIHFVKAGQFRKAGHVAESQWMPATIGIQLFKNEAEKRYFDTFCTETAFRLAGYYSPTIWNKILTQASEVEPCIRHAIIALGALGMTSRLSGDDTLSVDEREGDAAQHHHFALKQYNTAVLEMRRSLAKGGQNVRTALLCSLIIICFEIYHGQYHTALSQVHTALKLLDAWKLKQVSSRPHAVMSSPSPDTIDDELVIVFNRLDLQAMAHKGEIGASETHFRLKDEALRAVACMPDSFDSVIEAANYGKLVMCRVVHFLASTWTYDSINPVMPLNPYTVLDSLRNAPTQEGLDEQSRQLGALEKWHNAFLPVWRHSRTPHGSSWRHGSNCLELHYNLSLIGVKISYSTNELDYDDFNPLFKRMVSLAESLVDIQNATFTFDFRAVFVLDIIARKCRDRQVRREAIRLLKVRPRREGFCDSVVSAVICEWAVGVEEDAMEVDEEGNESIPEWARLRRFRAEFDWENRFAHICAEQRGMPGDVEEWIKREADITW